ncbi:ribonuclease P [Candidatus Woesearchaeota archaeon]|nr:ribonuclease P [Candidatus Woesearchaeota archaeon]
MKKVYGKRKEHQKIARERVEVLFRQAKEMFREDSSLSDRYVQLARKITMKYKVKIPSSLKRKFCKHCHKFLVPSVNCRIRVQRGKAVYYCLSCKRFMRIPYK